MRSTVVAILSVLCSVLLFELGSSLLGVLQPIRGLLEGFSEYSIGSLGTAYYLGFIAGCVFVPKLINAVGHVRTFSAFAAIGGVVALLTVLVIDLPAWFALRVVFGFSFAGLYTVVESWLNELATAKTRGRILAAYMSAVWLAVLTGKLLFVISDPLMILPFALVSMAISLSIVPVALTTGVTPQPHEAVRFQPLEVYRLAPIGVVTCFLIGLTNGAFWILGPVFAQSLMRSPEAVGFFMAALVLGGALAQWPIGRISDSVDRRWVIFVNGLAAAGFGVALSLLASSSETLFYLLAFGFGASALPIYSLCVAHVNDRASSDVFVQVSGQLLLTFGVAAILGPLMASFIVSLLGPQGLFLFTAIVHATVAAYTAWRIQRTEPPTEEERVPFSAVPRSTPKVFDLGAPEMPEQNDR